MSKQGQKAFQKTESLSEIQVDKWPTSCSVSSLSAEADPRSLLILVVRLIKTDKWDEMFLE